MPCATHKPPSAKRPSASSRGYDSAHKAEREKWWPLVATGRVPCRRGEKCRRFPDTLIHKGQPWDLGHPDAECQKPTAPEHRGCNRSAPGRLRR